MKKHYTPARIVFFVWRTRFVDALRRILPVLFVAVFMLACTVSTSASTVAQVPTADKLPVQNAAGTPTSDAPTAYAVSADKLNLRACGGTSCELLTVLERGAKLVPTGYVVTSWDKSEWWQVQTAEQTGWVNSRYIEVAK